MSDENNVKPLEFFLFRNYTVAVKKWLEKNTYLSTYSHDDNVTVAFMTPERAFAKYIYPTINGATTSPNINFYLSGNEYVDGENHLGFVREYKNFDDDKMTKVLKAPLIYKLTYSCTIFTRNLPEMDVLLYQILTKAHKNAKAAIEVDGQWAEIVAGNPTNETELSPAEAQDIIHRWAIELTIPRAYVPMDFEERRTIGNFTFEEDYD
jgi:hypothetical protein